MSETQKSSRRLLGIAAFLTILFVIPPAWGWHHQTAHKAINSNAVQLFQSTFESHSSKYARSSWLPDYLCTGTAVILPGGTSIVEGDLTFSVSEWIIEGGYYADEPEWTMALRHFYDPFSSNGVTYLTDTVPDGWGNPNVDAKTWALNHPENLDSWEEALLSYRLSMEVDDEERDRDLARAFRGLGETLHLLADMVQPAHVRNDSHPRDEPVEDTVRVKHVNKYGLNSPDPAVSIQGKSIEELFDILATFTSTRFYSCDSIYDVASGVMPRNDETPPANPQFSDMTLWDATYYATFSVGSIPMIQETLLGYILRTMGEPISSYSWCVPTAFADEQASVLIPIATNVGAAAIDRFLPTIDLQMTLSSATDGQVKVEGEMVHLIDNDPEWSKLGQGAIKYNGPGVLMRSDGKKLADVTFNDGTMEPLTVTVQDEGDDSQHIVYLQVDAGARQFKSKPAVPPEELKYPRVYEGTATRTVSITWEFDGGGSDSSTQTLDVQIKLWGNGNMEGFIGSTPSIYVGHQATSHEFYYTCPGGGTETIIHLTFGYSWDGRWQTDGSYDMQTSYYYEQAGLSGTYTDTQVFGSASYPERTFSPPKPCGSGETPVQVKVELTLQDVRLVSSG
ncbi:MAG: hypothetical protein JSV03_04665 [Planctomycetota bacterium]|nr:MAG: hypothetical protein JSV03_04665 [Planctomycetota bacterium]